MRSPITMDPVATLQRLEPTFTESGRLARRMQRDVHSYNKRETGNPAGDIVTEADLAVQEFLLREMSKTDLINCRLFAEEDTPSTSAFNERGTYCLGIDPIDDTAIYARGGDHFSTIVSLHDGKNILYLFVHFPAWEWTLRVVNGTYSFSGATPRLPLPPEAQNTIVYWSGDPEEHLPKDLLLELADKGLSFHQLSGVTKDLGSIALFATDSIAGVYIETINAYDGLVEFGIASARGQRIYSGGPSGAIGLNAIEKKESGLYYPGYYLALSDLAAHL